MPVNSKSLTNLVTVHLESGVTSEVHRVRASVEVQAWFKAMTAEERGAVLALLMKWKDRSVPAVIATYTGAVIEKPTAAPAEAPEAESAGLVSLGPSRPSGEALRWSGVESSGLSTAQAKVLGALGSGATLLRNGPAGQWSLWWPDGRIRAAGNPTVQALKRVGLLVPA